MKKLLLSFVSFMSILAMSFVCVFADVALPDGGQVSNTGQPAAYGRSSGGTDGHANLRCSITSTNGAVLSVDSATAVITSDVSSNLKLYVTMVMFYTTTEGSETASEFFPTQTTISTSGYTTKIEAPNRYGVKATAGYRVVFTTRGTFNCGITDEF